MNRERDLDSLIESLLADPAYMDHPLRDALQRLHQQNVEHLGRIERIARISDGYQSLAREQNLSLSERYHKQLRKLEKVARISDRYQQMMRDLNLALKEASNRDPLTALANRRMLIERLKEEVSRATRQNKTFVLAMVDVDHFKQINDNWGHDIGDRMLEEIARVLQAEVRSYDLCGRWGGEEFLILLPDTDLDSAAQVIERVRSGLRALAVRVSTELLSVSASFGVAEHRADESYSQTLNRADAALLQAKRNGRDRCIYANHESLDSTAPKPQP